MNIFFAVAILLAIGGMFILVRAAMLPNDFRVSRSTSIHATREKVFALINDMKAFNQWNPFAKMDPSTKNVYRGSPNGLGAAFDWEGTGKAGKGSLEIVEINAPTTVAMKLDIIKPMEGHNNVLFELQTNGDATVVTWTMTGPYPYINRIFGTIFNMDKIIGGSFESGLSDLKSLAER
jgi:carbon monoxide dehydrogenase subunit G